MDNKSMAAVEGVVVTEPSFSIINGGCLFTLTINHTPVSNGTPRVSFIEIYVSNEALLKLVKSTVAKGHALKINGCLFQRSWENERGFTESQICIEATEIDVNPNKRRPL